MTQGKRPDVPWQTIERVATQFERDEKRNLDETSDEEIDTELRQAGFAPGDAERLVKAALEKATARTAEPSQAPPAAPGGHAEVVSLGAEREKRASWKRPSWLMLVAAALLLVIVGGGATAVVAMYSPAPAPPQPVPPVPSTPPGPSPEQIAQQQRAKAEELRTAASEQCRGFRWEYCLEDLNKARDLDPGGDGTREMQRLRKRARRGAVEESTDTKSARGPRSIRPEAMPKLVAALSPGRGQAVHLVCAGGPEPGHLCDQVSAALGKAGWGVTRSQAAAGSDGPLAVRLEVSSGADDATQANADLLADALGRAFLAAHGPDDMAPGADEAPIRLTIGSQ